MTVQASYVLWIDIRGDLSTIGNESFASYFENHKFSERFATEGIDLVAMTDSGKLLEWYYDVDGANPSATESEDFTDVIGPTVYPEGTGDGRLYSVNGQQLLIDGVEEDETLKLVAGIFDWDNIDDDTVDVMAYFTPIVYTVPPFPAYVTYESGQIVPSSTKWEPHEWMPYDSPVPEPSVNLLLIAGLCLMAFRGRRKDN